MDRNELRQLAEQNWYLDDLQEALADAKKACKESEKKQHLTPTDRDYLYGILENLQILDIAQIYGKKARVVSVQLTNGLYKYVKKLLRYDSSVNITSINIPRELSLRYKKGSSEGLDSHPKVWWKIVLDIENYDREQVQNIVSRLGKIIEKPNLTVQKAELGSVLLVFETLKEDFSRIERFFRIGELTSLLGVQVRDLKEVPPSALLIYWRQLFQNLFEEDWQPVGLVLTSTKRRGTTSDDKNLEEVVERAKTFELSRCQTVDVVVQLISQDEVGIDEEVRIDEEVGINVWVYPSGDAFYLPVGLLVTILDEFGVPVPNLQERARSAVNAIALKFSIEPGEHFSIQLVLEDAIVTEHF